jgi:Na+/H+ antiporter NhaD/arsenite permease-like protein
MLIPLASTLFLLGYFLIAAESRLHLGKSGLALALGGVLWSLIGLHDPKLVEHHITKVSADIFNVVVFLLAAMSLVEILVHYRVFDVIRARIMRLGLTARGQFTLLCTIGFFLSAIIDNMTATIVMIQIARRFLKGANLPVAAVGIVIAANAGGAFSPIGDVTTIMLWLAHKFSASQVILEGFLPCVALLGVMLLLLGRKIRHEVVASEPEAPVEPLSPSEWIVISAILFSFFLPIGAKFIGLPPVLGILLGLGLTWLLVDLMKSVNSHSTHLNASIDSLIQKTDLASIKFFIGILLAVASLDVLGILDTVSRSLYGSSPTVASMMVGNVAIGLASAVFDNIPLTAMAIEMLDVETPTIWILLALMVGNGGSLLAIGSAAGVVAMGLVKDLTFERYFRIGFAPMLLALFACFFTWWIQYLLIFSRA